MALKKSIAGLMLLVASAAAPGPQVLQNPAPVMAWPTMMGLVVLLFGLGLYTVRRRPSRVHPDSVMR